MQTRVSAKRVRHRCVGCDRAHPHQFTAFCECGSMVDVEYDLSTARLYDSDNTYVHYFDLLPLEDPASLLAVQQAPTPTVHAERLGKELGLPWLYLKDETGLPTRTTKDRMAVTVLSFFRELDIREFVASSTGNSCTSLAYHLRYYPGCTMYVFMAEDFLPRLQFAETEQVVLFGLRGATFAEASDEAAAFAKRAGLISEGGFFDPARREGLKMAFLEAAEAVPRPIDWYVQAVSSAMGVYGVHKGARELCSMGRIERTPRLLCVQQETCAPMVRAFEAGSESIRTEHICHRPHGIASAILRGDPSRAYPYVRKIVNESGGRFTAVSESEIRTARRMVEELEGLSPCFAAAAAVAGLARLAKTGGVSRDDTVLVNLTGADRPSSARPPNVYWLERSGREWALADKDDPVARQFWEKHA